eukprot:3887421-Rhodomonas_salina.1
MTDSFQRHACSSFTVETLYPQSPCRPSSCALQIQTRLLLAVTRDTASSCRGSCIPLGTGRSPVVYPTRNTASSSSGPGIVGLRQLRA